MGLLSWLGIGSSAHQTGALSPYAGTSPLEAVTLAHLLDLAQDDALPVTRARAMSIPAVARARQVIAGSIGRVQWECRTGYNLASQQEAAILTPEGMTRAAALTYAWTADALLFYGRAWWIIRERHHGGRPRRFQWIPEESVHIDGATFVAYGQQIPAADVVRIDGPHEGLLSFGQETLKAARAISRAYGRTASNPTPAVELHQTTNEKITREEQRQLVADWIAARNSPTGAVGYTNAAIELRTHGLLPEQLLIAGRKAVVLEVAQLVNLPAWALDGEVSGSSITYSNHPSRTRELLDITLQPYLDAIAGRLSMDDVLARGTWARPLTDGLITPDFQTRMAGYQAAQAAGIYTVEQCQALETRTPLETTTETTAITQGEPTP